ncbi:MAG: HAD-IA family hydrolase [Bryobacteraceae bacterium]
MDLLIFDLDGTLIDSKMDLAQAVNATRANLGLPPLDLEQVNSYVGNGAPTLIRKALGPEFSDEEIKKALEYFLEYYRGHLLDHTTLYEGMKECLDQFQANGVKMAVLTNKPVRISIEILKGLGVADHFFRVYGGNSFEQKKPDPVGVEALIAEAGVPKERTMFVGDSSVDVKTARNAGVKVCGVTYGFQPETLNDDPPDFLVDRPDQLADVVTRNRA